MALSDKLEIGKAYSKKEFSKLIDEPKAESLQAGLLYCDNQNATILFITLDKKKKEKHHHYNDYFNNEYFEWDSQNSQSFENNRIQAIYNEKVDVYLMARVSGKIKGKTEPFIYCGEIKYYYHDKNSANPVHIIFRCLEYQAETINENLKELYNWKSDDYGKINSSKTTNIKSGRIDPKTKLKKPNKTERRGLVMSRVGQGYYRQQVLKKWNNQCAVTGSSLSKILIASHIVPWRNATDEERLDPENGILLSPNYDALFDKNLISFSDEGTLIISKSINTKDLKTLGIEKKSTIKVNNGMKPFLKKHRSKMK
jgi:hypothetical protein